MFANSSNSGQIAVTTLDLHCSVCQTLQKLLVSSGVGGGGGWGGGGGVT